MVKSLHLKLVLILVLLILLVMAAVGIFLINSVTSSNIDEFKSQMTTVFTTDFIVTLQNANSGGDMAAQNVRDVLSAYSSALGIDAYRDFYILDGETGDFLAGSNEALGSGLERTPNIISAMEGRVGDSINVVDRCFDVAIPISGDRALIVYVKDSKQELNELTWILLAITVQAMMFGLVVAILLSIILSKTITTPIEDLTRGAQAIAAGDFDYELKEHSNDEIGTLTRTFNEMAGILKGTLEEIEGERDKLNTLFLHMADGVIAFMRDGKLLQINPAAQEMLNIEDAKGLGFSDIFDGIKLPDEEVDKNKGFIEVDYEQNGRNLKIFFAPFGISDSERGVMAVIRDITEETKLDELRREFVANVSHELRTPLTNIKSYVETIIDDGRDLPDETREQFLEIILNESNRMTRIVKDLLTLSKIDYGKAELSLSEVSVKSLLTGAYNAILIDARNHGHTLRLEVEEDLPMVKVDRTRMEQVVVNILGNAVKYTPNGGNIVLSARRYDDKKIEICVEDNGIGIPESDMPRIFERFYRVDKARSREFGGTGLGLAIAREIVQQHNGEIEIESVFGSGTKVMIILPIDSSEKDGSV